MRIHADEPKPIIRVKPDSGARYRRYGFVDAVLGLDPVGKLGLSAADYRVRMLLLFLFSILGTFMCLCFLNSLNF